MAEEKKKLPKDFFSIEKFDDLIERLKSEDSTTVKEIIVNIETMVEAKTKTTEKLTYNQLRNIYKIVKKDDFKNKPNEFIFILPELAYIEARQKGEGRELVNFIREFATAIKPENDYAYFEKFMTALVAYHKLHVKS